MIKFPWQKIKKKAGTLTSLKSASYARFVLKIFRSKGHSNKDIDTTRTHLNFYCKKNEQTYLMIHTKDNEGNLIDKICARDFWRGRDSHRDLQNKFYKYITSKGFDLERGLPIEET